MKSLYESIMDVDDNIENYNMQDILQMRSVEKFEIKYKI